MKLIKKFVELNEELLDYEIDLAHAAKATNDVESFEKSIKNIERHERIKRFLSRLIKKNPA